MLDPEDTTRLTEKGIIEIAPLAYMRGRTLAGAYVILDEAQNTTPEQMMMFLTRLGDDSRMIITGDITQIDLPNPRKSGLLDAINDRAPLTVIIADNDTTAMTGGVQSPVATGVVGSEAAPSGIAIG